MAEQQGLHEEDIVDACDGRFKSVVVVDGEVVEKFVWMQSCERQLLHFFEKGFLLGVSGFTGGSRAQRGEDVGGG